ncbi:MAG: stage II sporulation protein M [Lachnospiraceae bacterium]|nr:stage II sporulation protein M [Lachnospiraceae bacterium]
MRRQFGIKNGYHMAYLFMIGLFMGILFVNLGHDTWITNGSLLGTEMMNRLKSSRPAGEGLVGYILRYRLFTGCLLCLISTTLIGMPFLCAYICYMGLSAGCLLSVAVIRYGIRGLLFIAAVLFPQALLLVPAYIFLFFWAADVNRTLYARGNQLEGYERYSSRFYLKKGMQVVGIMAVVIMGCLLESYVNPNIVQFVLKIF